MRLDKYLAYASLGMRKEVQQKIRQGAVTVNGIIVTVPETEICENEDCICYEGTVIPAVEKQYYMFHKPEGCITARTDEVKTTVLDYFKDVDTKALFPVGRLDKDTEGILFLTNDGTFDHWLMNPNHHVEKRYFFWALGSLDEANQEKLRNGISIGENEKITKPATLELVKSGLYQDLKTEIYSPIINQLNMHPTEQPVVAGYLTISEGRKHQVKRMLKAAGCYIIYLKRVSIGAVSLDPSLEKGTYRRLTQEEVDSLMQ